MAKIVAGVTAAGVPKTVAVESDGRVKITTS